MRLGLSGGKVEGDGLTKKERRALKVQEKNKQQVSGEQKAPVANKEQPATPGQLTEKELRRLEWEKKLAEQKAKPDLSKADNLSKAELRVKRREQQEAQRLAKLQQIPVEIKKLTPPPKKPEKIVEKKKVGTRLQIVSHLYSDATFGNAIVYKNVHPAFVRLGVQYSSRKILGSNARCRALLAALKCLINDLQTPPKQEFCRYLESVLQTCVDYLQLCRPLAVCMANALRHFKTQLQKVECIEDSVKKETLIEEVDTYIAEEIDKAGEAISMKVNEKVTDGDVILTYGWWV